VFSGRKQRLIKPSPFSRASRFWREWRKLAPRHRHQSNVIWDGPIGRDSPQRRTTMDAERAGPRGLKEVDDGTTAMTKRLPPFLLGGIGVERGLAATGPPPASANAISSARSMRWRRLFGIGRTSITSFSRRFVWVL